MSRPVPGPVFRHVCRRCGRHFLLCEAEGCRLPVMPAADAIADAETLRLFMRDGRHFCGLGHPEGWMLGAMDLSGGAKRYIARGWAERAARSMASGARAAFRAVPGLRE